MSKEQLAYRLLSNEINITNARLKRGQLYENDWLKLNKVIKFYQVYLYLLMILQIFQFKIYDQKSKNLF